MTGSPPSSPLTPPPLPPQLAVAMLSVNGRFLGTEVRPRKWK